MAKSSYLDNLINNKLPKNTYENRYLTELWNIIDNTPYNSYKNSLVNSFSDEVVVAVTGSDYLNNLNTNQTVLDMSNPWLSTVTLDSNYLPIVRTRRRISNKTMSDITNPIKTPPGYLPAFITAYKGGKERQTIPILFPAGFSRSISANYAKENPVGSSKPIVAYSYTDAEEIPFEFDALADYLPEQYATLKDYVEDILNILKPEYGSNKDKLGTVYEPTVVVQFADMKFTGICNSINVTYDNIYNYKSFVHARISCSFTRLG